MGADVRFGSARWAGLAVALINTAPSERQQDRLTAAGQLRELLLAHDEPGPVNSVGRVNAATTSPASRGLWVRVMTSRTRPMLAD